MPKNSNTFEAGLNTDISDLVIPNNMMRNCKNMRMYDLDGTSYAITTIRGTEQKFTLSSGYIPIASVSYGEILYIFSGKLFTGSQNSFERFELGSYPAPNYSNPQPGVYVEQYRPFQNLDGGAFNVDLFTLTKSDFVDISIQPDYDGSVNVILTAKNNTPRIVNSKFDKDFNLLASRTGSSSNEYTSASVDTETKLILRSKKILKIAYDAIENGGKLLHGNYVYLFRYMTDDFNETDIVNQSGICSVFEGLTETTIAAGNNAETTKRIKLSLSNVDTDFAYIKVYFKHNTGEDSNTGRVYELTNPISISGRSDITFIHDGYEDTAEVSEDTINVDFTSIDSVKTITQNSSYLLLGGIKETSIDYSQYIADSQLITARQYTAFLSGLSPYNNPENIYEKLSYFSAETYPLGIVYIMNDGSNSPVFPIQGYDEMNWGSLTTTQQNNIKKKGLLRFDNVETTPFTAAGNTIAKGITVNLAAVPQRIKDDSIGFFIVRAERKPDLISQGILIPTIRVPAFDFTRDAQIDNITDGNYYDVFDSEAYYKNYPILDNLIEAWIRIGEGGNPDYTVITRDGTNRISAGYMPCIVNNFDIPAVPGTLYVKDSNSWAYISADYMLNEARYITALQRSNLGMYQPYQVSMIPVEAGKLLNKWKDTGVAQGSNFGVDTSLLYEFNGLISNYAGLDTQEIEDLVYVPPATFNTGHNFISGLSARFRQNADLHFQARSFADAYFGMKVIVNGSTADSNSPYNEPSYTQNYDQCEGPMYDNIGTGGNKAYLISIYPRTSGLPITDINELYENVDGLSYKQISKRYTWSEAGNSINVFGGDCYIGKIYKRLNISGYDDPKEPSEILPDVSGYGSDLTADNINQGIVFSFVQECEYNPALRLPYLHVTSDPEKRTFYPYRDRGVFNNYRNYRLHETHKTNLGTSEVVRPKSFISIPENSPFIQSNFFTRIIHSEKHVPNAFQNGYRSYVGVNHQDYEPDMGEITKLLTHRGQLVVVFEHGVGVGPVNERIQTGSDSAGAIFVEPSGVLPPKLGNFSKEIGAQNGFHVIQTPQGIYGIDKSRSKIWQIKEGMVVISDMGFQQLMEKSSLTTITLGYDPQYHEVLFTTDEWTLCFKEGLEKFTSFYSFIPYRYARRARELYSFNLGTSQYELHNVINTQLIYGNIEQSYVEFVVNPASNIAKVIDYLKIVSNEVPPEKIELYSYKIETKKLDVIDYNATKQYVSINNEVNFFTQEDQIFLRDREYIVQIPNVEYIDDVDWSEGRFRDKYVIIRLTYETDQKVELLSVITDYRLSAS